MKVAVLISGAYRNSTEPILGLLKWLRSHEGYEVDTYIHAWWDKSYVGKRHRHDHLSVVEDDPSNEIREKIKPVKFLLEPQCSIDFSGLPFKTEFRCNSQSRELTYFTILSQMESLKRCFQLIEDSSQYDFIFRLRGDMYIEDESYKIPFTKKDLDLGRAYISDGEYYTGWPFGDWAFLARPDIMESFILNGEKLFRHICKELGYFPHIHVYFPSMFQLIKVEPVRWGIRFTVTRHSKRHCAHILLDKESNELGADPFFWHLIDKDRLMIQLE